MVVSEVGPDPADHALQLKVQRAWRNATARDAGLAMSMRFAKAPDGKGYEPVLG